MTPDERVARGIGVLGEADAGELLTLQLAAWVREAIVNDDLRIPPLHDSLDDVRRQLTALRIWGLREDGRLIGTVRTSPLDDATVLLARLAVVPDLRGHGLGSALLRFAEAQLPEHVERIELITGAKSESNQALYGRHGYKLAERLPGMGAIRMAKVLRRR